MPEKHKIHLEERYLDQIRAVAEAKPEIQKVFLFGSRARGDHRERSDIDLCVVLNEKEDPMGSLFKLDLEEDTTIPYMFDVVDLNKISDPVFKEQILKEGILIWQRDSNQSSPK